MLPGLRFLFAASLVCASLLIFGMGAIALLRASHQQFASAPPGPPPEPVFAQAPQTVPSLSMLRVEPRAESASDGLPKDADRIVSPDAPRPESPSSPSPASGAVAEAPPPVPSPETAGPAAIETPKAAEPAAPETIPAAEPATTAVVPQGEPAETGSLAMPEDQPVSEPATTESTPSEPAAAAPAVAEPPLPQAWPEVAAIAPKASSKAEPAPASVRPKPVVKRKVRRAKRHRAKTEKLPAVSSAPTLGSLFSGK